MPQISVIVPVYKVEPFIHQCVDSILAQTFTDFELILVDDGSPDRCGAICDEYAKKDSRIRVIHKQNGGVSSARNTGLENAKGQYVLFCDSDDYAEPEWCEQLVGQIKKHPQSWCFCGCHCVDANGQYVEKNCVFHQAPTYEVFSISEYDQVYQTNYSALLWIRIFDMSIIRKHQLRFDENMSVSEDVLFNLEYGKYCDSFSVVNLPLYNHRVYLNNEVSHLDGQLPSEMFYINQRIYRARKHFIADEYRTRFETDFFYRFIGDIKGLANKAGENRKSKTKSIREIIKSQEFQTALRNADTSKESWKLLLPLKCGIARVVLSLFEGR